MNGCKRTALMPRQTSYNALYVNPDHNSSSIALSNSNNQDKENSIPNNNNNDDVTSDKENNLLLPKKHEDLNNNNKSYKPSSLQLCMQRTEPDKELFGGSSGDLWDPPSVASDNSSSLKIWDYSDSEAAPASSWSTLPNKSLLCRPLPIDVGRCTCVIVKEKSSDGGYLFSLYTNEGKGRQDRKLAIARHKRRNGRSELTIAQNMKGISSNSDDSFIGVVSANLMGSKYQIWDQGKRPDCLSKPSKSLLAAVSFTPTISTWTGRYRRIRAYVPKHQSMQLKNTAQVQHIKGLPTDWEGNMEKIHQLYSKIPAYNKLSKQYELDFRDRGRAGLRIQSSVKNFQLTLEENGKQTILQLGRVGKAKYVMDYRYPLTGYQAFCICLASIDSKLCCAV